MACLPSPAQPCPALPQPCSSGSGPEMADWSGGAWVVGGIELGQALHCGMTVARQGVYMAHNT